MYDILGFTGNSETCSAERPGALEHLPQFVLWVQEPTLLNMPWIPWIVPFGFYHILHFLVFYHDLDHFNWYIMITPHVCDASSQLAL